MKIFGFLSKNIVLIILILVAVLIYYPSLMIGFSLIDDAYTVKLSRDLISAISGFNLNVAWHLLFEAQDGRVRPIYWVIQTTISRLAFFEPYLMHLARLLQLLATALLIYFTTKKLKITKGIRYLVIFVFIYNFQNFENYYRIGPSETFQVLFLALTLFLLLYDKFHYKLFLALVMILSFLSSFTKEQYFTLAIAFAGGYFLTLRQRSSNNEIARLRIKLLAITLILVFSGVLIFLFRTSYGDVSLGYSSHYRLNNPLVISNAIDFLTKISSNQFPFFQISLLYLIIFLMDKTKKFNFTKGDIYYLLLWFSATVQFLVLLPWDFPVERYLLIVNYLLVLIYAITLGFVVQGLRKYVYKKYKFNFLKSKITVLTLTTILLTTFFVRNYFPIANFQLWQEMDTSFAAEILNSLATNVKREGSVFVNYKKGESNLEIFLSTAWSLQQFYDRDDIVFFYIDHELLCTAEERYIFDRTSDRQFNPGAFKNNNFEVIAEGNKTYSPLTYGDVKKSFILGYKTENWKVDRKYEWHLYKQKPNTCIKN